MLETCQCEYMNVHSCVIFLSMNEKNIKIKLDMSNVCMFLVDAFLHLAGWKMKVDCVALRLPCVYPHRQGKAPCRAWKTNFFSIAKNFSFIIYKRTKKVFWKNLKKGVDRCNTPMVSFDTSGGCNTPNDSTITQLGIWTDDGKARRRVNGPQLNPDCIRGKRGFTDSWMYVHEWLWSLTTSHRAMFRR